MAHHITRRALGALVLGAAAAPAAGALPVPAGKTILTVSGRIGATNRDGAAEFDRAMLEALGTEGFETTAPWYNGPVRFEGVPMQRLMEAVAATGDTVAAVALNDYTTDIPVSDFRRYGVLLALKRDGAYMPVRDKGPLFLVYPYDSRPELKSTRFYSRSTWQLAKLVVK